MPIKPPTCRTCGKAEFNHRCMGALVIAEKVTPAKKPKKKAKPKK